MSGSICFSANTYLYYCMLWNTTKPWMNRMAANRGEQCALKGTVSNTYPLLCSYYWILTTSFCFRRHVLKKMELAFVVALMRFYHVKNQSDKIESIARSLDGIRAQYSNQPRLSTFNENPRTSTSLANVLGIILMLPITIACSYVSGIRWIGIYVQFPFIDPKLSCELISLR